jgi:hypothetical protein
MLFMNGMEIGSFFAAALIMAALIVSQSSKWQ